MHQHVPGRFWAATAMALSTATLGLITIVHHTWIETVFGVNLDQSNGSLEWVVVSVALTIALVSTFIALRAVGRREAMTA
jgi:hypothetical protein